MTDEYSKYIQEQYEELAPDLKYLRAFYEKKEEPLAVPADNVKPKIDKSPKKRSPRLSSEQKRRNRAKRAKDERKAKRALGVDAPKAEVGKTGFQMPSRAWVERHAAIDDSVISVGGLAVNMGMTVNVEEPKENENHG